MFYFETFRIIFNPSSVKKWCNTRQCQQFKAKSFCDPRKVSVTQKTPTSKPRRLVMPINGNACLQYNIKKVSFKDYCIVPMKFAPLINWSTKNFKILNLVFLGMTTRTDL